MGKGQGKNDFEIDFGGVLQVVEWEKSKIPECVELLCRLKNCPAR